VPANQPKLTLIIDFKIDCAYGTCQNGHGKCLKPFHEHPDIQVFEIISHQKKKKKKKNRQQGFLRLKSQGPW
jgi:hypothetical protein